MKYNSVIALITAGLCLAVQGYAQSMNGVTHSGQSTGQPPFPVTSYM